MVVTRTPSHGERVGAAIHEYGIVRQIGDELFVPASSADRVVAELRADVKLARKQRDETDTLLGKALARERDAKAQAWREGNIAGFSEGQADACGDESFNPTKNPYLKGS